MHVNSMGDTLTSKQYWETYYKHNHANRIHIERVCSYYDYYWDLLFEDDCKTNSLIEIGGYPGRFLAYLADKYKVIPTCLDYNSDVKQIEATFKVMEVHDYYIQQEDFTRFRTKQKYNFVISNGFIEHFENFNHILDLHLQYLKNDGKLLVMIPNMRGYIRLYKYFVDYKNLKTHNLKSMKLKVFRDFAERNHLKIKQLSYFGEFPYNVHQKLNLFQKIIFKTHRLLFKKVMNRLVNRNPSSYFSSGIIAIFERK